MKKNKGSLNIVAIDDDIQSLKDLEEAISVVPEANLLLATTDISDLLKCLSEHEDIDVAIIDINMPHYNGFDIARHLKDNNPKTKIIFYSAYEDFALKGYKYYPEDFLTKPLNALRLKQTLSKLVHLASEKKQRKIGVQSDRSFVLVDVKDITFIEKKLKKSVIHLSESTIKTNAGLNKLEDQLKGNGFFRCHQSYLVPLDKIVAIQPDELMKSYNLRLQDTEKLISVSKYKYQELRKRIKEL
ncbi:LytR/AlgR family response regulator transcription factor [Halobacillus litoralis]|nr:LytTR family DNA-binding domain-containing protein [Halobacillus litoralis]